MQISVKDGVLHLQAEGQGDAFTLGKLCAEQGIGYLHGDQCVSVSVDSPQNPGIPEDLVEFIWKWIDRARRYPSTVSWTAADENFYSLLLKHLPIDPKTC